MDTRDTRPTAAPRLGLGANLAQFSLLVAVNALVGGMVGQERTVVPLMAGEIFGLEAVTAALTFIVAFGLTKAITNLVAGGVHWLRWTGDGFEVRPAKTGLGRPWRTAP